MVEGRKRPKGGLAAACLAILLGGAILALAVPRVGASFWLGLRDYEAELGHTGLLVSESGLRGLIASRELALGWVESRGAHVDVAEALELLAADAEPEGAAKRGLLERAIGEMQAGLALAPAGSRDWLRLAYLTALLNGRDPRAAEAVQLAIRTSPYDAPEFLAWRLDLSLYLWPLFDDAAERQRIERQIRLAWEEAPEELAGLALDAPEYRAVIYSALDEFPQLQQRLTGLMRELTQEVRLAPRA